MELLRISFYHQFDQLFHELVRERTDLLLHGHTTSYYTRYVNNNFQFLVAMINCTVL